jgi:hypothetical protein
MEMEMEMEMKQHKNCDLSSNVTNVGELPFLCRRCWRPQKNLGGTTLQIDQARDEPTKVDVGCSEQTHHTNPRREILAINGTHGS